MPASGATKKLRLFSSVHKLLFAQAFSAKSVQSIMGATDIRRANILILILNHHIDRQCWRLDRQTSKFRRADKVSDSKGFVGCK